MPNLRSRADPAALIVNIIDPLERRDGGLGRARHAGVQDAGAVDCVVDAGERLDRGIHKVVHEGLVGDVAGAVEYRRAGRGFQYGGFGRLQGGAVDVCDGDPGAAGLDEGFGCGGADAWYTKSEYYLLLVVLQETGGEAYLSRRRRLPARLQGRSEHTGRSWQWLDKVRREAERKRAGRSLSIVV